MAPSEHIIYFDAPIIHFQKSQDPSPPVMESDPSAHLPPVEHSIDEKENQINQTAPIRKDEPDSTETAPTKTSKDGDVRKDSIITSSSPTADSSLAPIGLQ